MNIVVRNDIKELRKLHYKIGLNIPKFAEKLKLYKPINIVVKPYRCLIHMSL